MFTTAPHCNHVQQRDNERPQPSISEQRRNIVLVDAHLLIRSAFQKVMNVYPYLHVISSCQTIDDGLALLDKADVHTFLLGPSVSVSDCLYLVKFLHQRQLSVGIVVIQQHLRPETAVTLIKKGVHSLLDEHTSEQDFIHAILAASTGNTFLSRHTKNILNLSMMRAPMHFTDRELQVLSCLRRGASNGCIAHELSLKEKTVEKYLTHIYSKINVTSRSEALLFIQDLHI